jgi:hypothetical protein
MRKYPIRNGTRTPQRVDVFVRDKTLLWAFDPFDPFLVDQMCRFFGGRLRANSGGHPFPGGGLYLS